MYKRVLVAIDGSAFSREALQHVPLLAPAEVLLVGVWESVADGISRRTGVVADVPPDIAEKVKRAEVDRVHDYLRDARRELEAMQWSGEASVLVRHGKPGEQIVQVASETGCDVVVMATHGRSGFKRAFVGSVADYVVHYVTGGAVLLVRPTPDEEQDPA